MREYNWPSREKWAEQQRTPYYDKFENLITNDIAAYASPDEVEAAIKALRAVWCHHGRSTLSQSGIAREFCSRFVIT
jgi:hypothetical protein